MKNVASITAIMFASSLALVATGCDRTPEQPTPGERMDNAATDSRNAISGMGDTIERRADQAGQAIDDASITASIKGKYLVDDTLKGLDISVDTEQGVVTLTGPVQSDTAKELATQIAENVEGVVRVDNQLTVQ
jgi:hyperosmotically inducible protein